MRQIFPRILLAFRVFFRILFNAAVAEQVARTVAGGAPPTVAPAPMSQPKQPPAAKPLPRREAITLLAAIVAGIAAFFIASYAVAVKEMKDLIAWALKRR